MKPHARHSPTTRAREPGRTRDDGAEEHVRGADGSLGIRAVPPIDVAEPSAHHPSLPVVDGVRWGVVADRVHIGLRRVFHAHEASTRVVSTVLSGLTDEERRAVKDSIFGVTIQRLRLLRDRPAPVTDEDFDDLVRRAAVDEPGPWPENVIERLIWQRSCPRWLVERLIDALGNDGADAFLRASNQPGPRTLRANTLVNNRDELIAALADEGLTARKNPRSPWAVDVVGRANLFGCRAFRDGRFEVQDASSQAVVVAADVRPGDVVVDLCAGRGGKTLALAAAMTDRGALWFHDVDERALADLRGRLLRARVTCARRGLPDDGTADVVLVDAPCSSTGVLRRWPDLRYTLRADDVEGYAGVQRALLARAARLVRPGGRVVYATCSVLRAENDAVVDDLIVNDIFDRIDPRLLHDGPHDRPTTTRGEPALITQSRTLLAPREPGDGDGFFFAVLLRTR